MTAGESPGSDVGFDFVKGNVDFDFDFVGLSVDESEAALTVGMIEELEVFCFFFGGSVGSSLWYFLALFASASSLDNSIEAEESAFGFSIG